MKEILSKRERVERTLNFLPIDRVAIHDHIWNPGVVSLYTGKRIYGFNYSLEDVCEATRKTMDMCRFPDVPVGTGQVTTEDGFVVKLDNWTSWFIKKPFSDVKGLKEYCLRTMEKMETGELDSVTFQGTTSADKTRTVKMETIKFDPEKVREDYHKKFHKIQKLVGDTVMMDISQTGLDACWVRAGLDLFTYLYYDEPEIIQRWIEVFTESEIRRIHDIADRKLSPVILLVGDISSKVGPIFCPEFLRKEHFPNVARLVEAWHSHGFKVLYHSDGNWKMLIPDFLECGVDGFYCLEPAVGMDIIELKNKYPKVIWAGGLDGVDLMERGNPDEVRKEVRRQIEETNTLNTGGLFLGTSSEINPPIKIENYRAMIDTGRSIYNERFLL